MKHFKGNHGFTLAETITALALFTLVIAGATALVMSSMSQTSQVQNGVELQNKSEAVLTNMWQSYNTASENNKNIAEIQISKPEDAPEGFNVKTVIINGQQYDPKGSIGIDPSKEQNVEIITSAENQEDVHLKTQWKPVDDGTRMCGVEPGALTK